MKEALEKGRAAGIAAGKAEGKAEVAKKLLDLGFEITKVAEATGLSEKDIRSLKD